VLVVPLQLPVTMQKGKGRGLSGGTQSEERVNEKVKLNQPTFLLFFFSSPAVSFSEFKWRAKNIVQDKGQEVILSQ